MKTYIGIDNGTSGTIGVIGNDDEFLFIKTPIMKVQDYTKAKKFISRLDVDRFANLLRPHAKNSIAIMERPMINPTRFASSISAARCHEAMLTVLEMLAIPYLFIDSKEWQKDMLPKGCQKEELKKASFDIGNRLFPICRPLAHPDRDGILIAEWARRKQL